MDYEKLFNDIFDKCPNEWLEFLLSNEEVPFSYCLKAFKKKIPWAARAAIALRRDCPDDMLLKLCRKGGNKFADRLLSSKREISDEAMMALLEHDGNCQVIALSGRDLSDKIKKAVFDKLVIRNNNGEITEVRCGFHNFIMNQSTMPKCCLDEIKKELLKNNNRYFVERLRIASKFLFPLNEKEVLKCIDNEVSLLEAKQIASNATASDYVLMNLRMKINSNEVSNLIESHKKNREQYRSNK